MSIQPPSRVSPMPSVGYSSSSLQVISPKEWGTPAILQLPPYPQELNDFLAGDCTIWSGCKRLHTHVVVPLFPEVNIDGTPVPLTLGTLNKLDKTSGGPGYRSLLNRIPNDLSAEPKFLYGVMTKDVIPGTKDMPYEDQIELLSAINCYKGYQVPSVLDAARALLWSNRCGNRLFKHSEYKTSTVEETYAYTRCKEVVNGVHVIVGGFTSEGLDVTDDRYVVNCGHGKLGVAGWRTFSL